MIRHYGLVALFTGLCLLSGIACNDNKGVSADPDKARDVLKQSMEAWQKGETPDAFKLRTNITVAERRWNDGVQLLSFEIATESDMNGFDWQCTVKTKIKDKNGKTSEEKAIYCVSTAPNLVVVRTES
jgi:hypothetical protein